MSKAIGPGQLQVAEEEAMVTSTPLQIEQASPAVKQIADAPQAQGEAQRPHPDDPPAPPQPDDHMSDPPIPQDPHPVAVPGDDVNMVDGENPQVENLRPGAHTTPIAPGSARPETNEEFMDSIFDMEAIAESQPPSPVKFITPMKLQRSPRMTNQEVNAMFAAERNELARKLSAVFAANQLQAQELAHSQHAEMSVPILEQSEAETPGGSMNEPEMAEPRHPPVDKQVAPPSPIHHRTPPSRIPVPSPARPRTQDVADSDNPVPSPARTRTQDVANSLFPPSPPRPKTNLRRPPTPPASPMVIESPAGPHNRPETPPSPTPERRRSTRQGKQPQPCEPTPPPTSQDNQSQRRQPTPPPTAAARAKTKGKGGLTSKKTDKTDKKLKRVLYGGLVGALYRNPHFLDTPPAPVSTVSFFYIFHLTRCQMDVDGLRLHIFSKDPGSSPRVHVFKTHKKVVSDIYHDIRLHSHTDHRPGRNMRF